MTDKEKLPAHLPGLDLAEALARTEIPASVFRPILLRFAEKNHDRAQEMVALLAAGDLQGLQGMAHTLKGASGAIGAFTLHQACLAVEMAAKAEGGTEEIQALLEELGQALAVVLTSLATLR